MCFLSPQKRVWKCFVCGNEIGALPAESRVILSRLTFPGVRLAFTLVRPKIALRSDDLPTFGWPIRLMVNGDGV